MSEKVVNISDSDFENEVMESNIPVVVDFWAPWCGPCKAIGPIIDELATKYDGKVKFTKCNVDENPTTPSKYSVRAIPTILLIKKGTVIETITGMTAKAKLEALIDGLL